MTSGRAARDHVGEASRATAWTLWSQATSESRAGRSGSRGYVPNRGQPQNAPKESDERADGFFSNARAQCQAAARPRDRSGTEAERPDF